MPASLIYTTLKAAFGDQNYHRGKTLVRINQDLPAGRVTTHFDDGTPDGTSYKESQTVKAGDRVVTYDCEGVKVGCTICYDLRFPGLFRALADRGAEMIAVPSAFTQQTGKDHWEVLLRARAIETETYVCAAAQTGTFTVNNETRATYGHSLVADPWGLVVAKASDGVGVVSTRLDMALVKRVRKMIPVAQHKVNFAA